MAAVAVRERREGLVGWLVRSVRSLPASLSGIVRGFLLEVVAVFAALGRSIAFAIPGVRQLAERRPHEGGDSAPPTQPRRRLASVLRAHAPGVGSTSQRVPAATSKAAQARRARQRRRIQLALAVVLLAAITAAVILVPRSDAFRIRHLQVTGAGAVSDLQVREQIDRLLVGKTVFTVDEDALARRIETFPFVESVEVERHLPGGIELHISEYQPLALALGDGGYWLVARDGRVLAKADEEEWRGRVPLVTLRSDSIAAGNRLDDEPALQLLAARGSRSSLMFELVEAEAFRLVATMPSGIEIRFGRPAALREKVLSAELALARARREGITPAYVDVSVPAKPAICNSATIACGMARTGREMDAADEAGAATTPEELGGDEAVVEAAASGGDPASDA